ncbi:MAG: M16 family metallopeptidase, partial [Candidatus Binatia bacterium]
YQTLVYEKRLARSAGASYDLTSVDPSLFYVYAQPMPGKAVRDVEKELLGQIREIQRTPIGRRELTKAKNGLEARFVLGQDSLFYQALLLGQYEIAGDWRQIDNYVPTIRAVTADDVSRVARFYFTSDNRTVGTLEPLPVRSGQRHGARSMPGGAVR